MGNGTYCQGKISIITQSEHIITIIKKRIGLKNTNQKNFVIFHFSNLLRLVYYKIVSFEGMTFLVYHFKWNA